MNHPIEKLVAQSSISLTVTTGKNILKTLTNVGEKAIDTFNKIYLFKTFQECSISSGGYVKILPEMNCIPTLIGNDERPVFLYQLVEALDEFVDYDRIEEEYPTLSYAQIVGGVSFLRKLAQTNTAEIDVDDLEDEFDSKDTALIEELRTVPNSGEEVRVFIDSQ